MDMERIERFIFCLRMAFLKLWILWPWVIPGFAPSYAFNEDELPETFKWRQTSKHYYSMGFPEKSLMSHALTEVR